MAGDTLLFVFGLFDTGALLFLTVYFVSFYKYWSPSFRKNSNSFSSCFLTSSYIGYNPFRFRMWLFKCSAVLLKIKLCKSCVDYYYYYYYKPLRECLFNNATWHSANLLIVQYKCKWTVLVGVIRQWTIWTSLRNFAYARLEITSIVSFLLSYVIS